jgi:hypothetical protein
MNNIQTGQGFLNISETLGEADIKINIIAVN